MTTRLPQCGDRFETATCPKHNEEILMKAILKNTVVTKQVNDRVAFWRGAQEVA